MDFHLERGLRLHTEPEYKNLYSWAINEIDAQGKQIGHDQIPWDLTLNFTATSCALGDSIDIESRFQKEKEATPKVTQRQIIRVQLRPGHPWDDERGFRRSTSFSMFGTDRTIKSFELQIHPITDPAEQERCWAWGSVSYTHEFDVGRNETTDDCVIFYLMVKPDTFARYGAKVAHGLVDEMVLRVKSVAGFYSEWSPSISTDSVKVLSGGDEQKVILPPGLSFEPPRLGQIDGAELFINRRLEFRKRAPEPEAAEEISDTGTERAVQSPTAVDPRMLQMLVSLKRAAWLVVCLLALIFVILLRR